MYLAHSDVIIISEACDREQKAQSKLSSCVDLTYTAPSLLQEVTIDFITPGIPHNMLVLQICKNCMNNINITLMRFPKNIFKNLDNVYLWIIVFFLPLWLWKWLSFCLIVFSPLELLWSFLCILFFLPSVEFIDMLPKVFCLIKSL